MSRPTQGLKISLHLRGYHSLWHSFPTASVFFILATGLIRVRSPLLTESLIWCPFLQVLRCFSSLRSLLTPYFIQMKIPYYWRYLIKFKRIKRSVSTITKYLKRWVTPFGNLRIKGYSHLPVAYRSVLRPSSPVHAKAFTRCPLRHLIVLIANIQSLLYFLKSIPLHTHIKRRISTEQNFTSMPCKAQTSWILAEKTSFLKYTRWLRLRQPIITQRHWACFATYSYKNINSKQLYPNTFSLHNFNRTR